MKDNKLVKPPEVSMKPTLAKTKKMAQELTKFITDNKLAADIAGKQYVMVEGWEFAGSQLGLGNTIVSVEKIPTDDPKEVKYMAHAEIRHLTTGNIVSSGFAVCSNKEGKKKTFEEYAVLSMAQTRAIGKAYRNTLSWLIKAAGFEPTPVEELSKEDMEAELSKAKQMVVRELNKRGITDSQHMLAKIQEAIKKDSIETVDEAKNVIRLLRSEDEQN